MRSVRTFEVFEHLVLGRGLKLKKGKEQVEVEKDQSRKTAEDWLMPWIDVQRLLRLDEKILMKMLIEIRE